MAWEMWRCWHNTMSIDRRAEDGVQAGEWASVKMETLRGQETAGGRGMGGHDSEGMPECPREARTGSPVTDTARLGKRDREWPRQHKVMWKKIPLSPPTHPPTHPSIPVSAHHSAPLNILGSQNILKIVRKKRGEGREGTLGEIEVRDEAMAGDSGSVSGRNRS